MVLPFILRLLISRLLSHHHHPYYHNRTAVVHAIVLSRPRQRQGHDSELINLPPLKQAAMSP